MCYTIDSESILLNYFSKGKSKEISYSKLREIRKAIEDELSDVYVDITLKSILDAARHNKLDVRLTSVYCNNLNFNLEDINSRLPNPLKESYLETLEKLVR